MKKLVLFDGMAIVYRAYYALGNSPRMNSKGVNTSAVLGFTNTVYDLVKKLQPTHVAVAFDVHAPTFRHEMYADYKGTRHAMPEELREQVPLLQKLYSRGCPISAASLPHSTFPLLPVTVMRLTM